MRDNFFSEECIDEEKRRVKSQHEKCPICGFSLVATILYGDIGYSLQLSEQMEKREVVLGGCSIHPDMPRWQCTKCGTKFYKVR